MILYYFFHIVSVNYNKTGKYNLRIITPLFQLKNYIYTPLITSPAKIRANEIINALIINFFNS
jgi:hypothetical protein